MWFIKDMAHAPTSSGSSAGGNSTSKVIRDFILGGTSGAIAKTLAAPIERVKLLLQTQENNPKLKDNPYKGIVDCFQRCVREEGVSSLWRGNWANILRYFPTQAINFSVKDALNRTFLSGVDSKTQRTSYFLRSLLSGGLAGSFSLIFVYPLDFARTRLGADIGKAAGERQFNGLFDCCKQILVKDGITGLYQGFTVSVIGIFTYRAFYFGYIFFDLVAMMLVKLSSGAALRSKRSLLSWPVSPSLSWWPQPLRPWPIPSTPSEEDWWWKVARQKLTESIEELLTVVRRSSELRVLLDSSRATCPTSGEVSVAPLCLCSMMNCRSSSTTKPTLDLHNIVKWSIYNDKKRKWRSLLMKRTKIC